MPTPRLGIVVPKRGTRLAVRRNRIKRLIRESFRLHIEEIPPVDVVVQVFKSIEDDRLVTTLAAEWVTLRLRFEQEMGSETNRSH